MIRLASVDFEIEDGFEKTKVSKNKGAGNRLPPFSHETVPDPNGTVVIVSYFKCSVYAIQL
jgi:hypothetical protein